ncbi:MAG: hypothetical protein ABI783_02275 [Actinomycetota bacterium]
MIPMLGDAAENLANPAAILPHISADDPMELGTVPVEKPTTST